jgi:hypothetical protein
MKFALLSSSANSISFCAQVEWFDTQATLARKYQLLYFAIDDTIEIVSSVYVNVGEEKGKHE